VADTPRRRRQRGESSPPPSAEVWARAAAVVRDRQLYAWLLECCAWHLRRVGSAEEAADTLLEFLQISLPGVVRSYRPEYGKTFDEYLELCLRNFARRRARQILRYRRFAEPLPDDTEDLEDESSLSSGLPPEELEAIRRVLTLGLAVLRADDREVLVLRYLEDLSEADIAHRLAISGPATKSRLNRARTRLREILEAEGLTSSFFLGP
jgi:RNA polymerase sigma factor (sigma-70 family)